MTDMIGTTIAAALTLMVFSYLLRDNPLHRLAQYLLVASVAAYAAIAAIRWVLWPLLLHPLVTNPTDSPDLLIPFILGILLLTKFTPRFRSLGTISLAYLVGLGVALAVGGATLGTLLPQSTATMLPVIPNGSTTVVSAVSNGILILGTLFTLLSFLYLSRRPATSGEAGDIVTAWRPAPWVRVGRFFTMMTLGAIFGGLGLTFISLLVGRLDFLINEWLRPLIGF